MSKKGPQKVEEEIERIEECIEATADLIGVYFHSNQSPELMSFTMAGWANVDQRK
jgi:hypothetical protein